MSYDGWIKWHRKSLDNPLFRDPAGWHLWEYCCLKANHEPHKVLFKGEPMVVNRGQFLFGRHQAAADIGIPAGSIHRKMKLLENLEMLSIQTSNKFSIVTIRNYDKYQAEISEGEQQSEQQMSNKRASSEHQVSTNKNDKNEKKRNTDARSKKTRSKQEDIYRISYDLETYRFKGITKEDIQRWVDTYPAVNIEFQLKKAEELLRANPKKRKQNYLSFLNNWFSKAQQWGGDIPSNQPGEHLKEL